MDLRRIYVLQALRALVYGFASVLLGTSLARAGLSGAQVGLVFASMLAGSALTTIVLAGGRTSSGGAASTPLYTC